jgi:hypothetical protein
MQILRHAAETRSQAELLPIIRSHFQALLDDRGDWNLSIYDLAWVLCTDFFGEQERKEQLAELLAAQNLDGTWGDASYVPHSALIDTLAVAMMLTRLGQPIPLESRFREGVGALLHSCEQYPHHATVAFEVLAPKLLRWLAERGTDPVDGAAGRAYVERLESKGDKKLALLRSAGGLWSRASSLSFAAELSALVPITATEAAALGELLLQNGAVGLSPAATAGVMLVLKEQGQSIPPALHGYLRATFEDYGRRGFPDLHPIVASRRLWNVLPWLVSGNILAIGRDPGIRDVLVRIHQELQPDSLGRIAWDTNIGELPDLDDTAVALALFATLTRLGVKDLRPMSSTALTHFQREDGSFFCYPHELHPSPAAILHTLMAVGMASSVPSTGSERLYREIGRKALLQLDPRGKSLDELCHDKWHATWAYGAQRWLSLRELSAVHAPSILAMAAEIVGRARRGGFGQKEPTLEETAYVASGLASMQQSGLAMPAELQASIQAALRASSAFLLDEMRRDRIRLPPIWISKNLYAPRFQIVSAVLEALYNVRGALATP